MSNLVCLAPKSGVEIKCLCFDQKPCDIRIDDGGHLVCRYGNNENVIDGIVSVVCPLEIDVERKKWEEFLKKEISTDYLPDYLP